MSSANTIPAESGRACDCCGRTHRTLILCAGGFWLGKQCAADLERFRLDSNIKSLAWRGYEPKHAQLEKMLNGAPAVTPRDEVLAAAQRLEVEAEQDAAAGFNSRAVCLKEEARRLRSELIAADRAAALEDAQRKQRQAEKHTVERIWQQKRDAESITCSMFEDFKPTDAAGNISLF